MKTLHSLFKNSSVFRPDNSAEFRGTAFAARIAGADENVNTTPATRTPLRKLLKYPG